MIAHKYTICQYPPGDLPISAILHVGSAVSETTETGIVQLVLLQPLVVATTLADLLANVLCQVASIRLNIDERGLVIMVVHQGMMKRTQQHTDLELGIVALTVFAKALV